MFDADRVKQAVREILSAIGEDPNREELGATPNKVAEAYAEFFKGVGGQGGRADLVFRGGGGHGHAASDLAVDLQHQFHGVAGECRLIHMGPGRIQHVAKRMGISQLTP